MGPVGMDCLDFGAFFLIFAFIFPQMGSSMRQADRLGIVSSS